MQDKIDSLIADIRRLDELKDLIIEMKQEKREEIEKIEKERTARKINKH